MPGVDICLQILLRRQGRRRERQGRENNELQCIRPVQAGKSRGS